MKTKDWLLVGIGAVFGILCVRQFGTVWWLGIIAGILGGAFGYFSDDPLGRWAKLKVAVRSAKSELDPLKEWWGRQATVRAGWRKLVLAPVSIAVSVFCWFCFIFWLNPENEFYSSSFIADFSMLVLGGLVFTVVAAVFSTLVIGAMFRNSYLGSTKDEVEELDMLIGFSILGNPIGFLFVFVFGTIYLFYHIFRCVWMELLPALWRFSTKATKRFFLYIHDERSVCRATYASIGAYVGWYFDQSPIIGFVSGIVAGMLIHKVAQVVRAKEPEIAT